MERLVYSEQYDSNVLRITTTCQVMTPYNPFEKISDLEGLQTYRALWDTGATITCVSSRVVSDLNLVPLSKTIMHLASGSVETEEYAIDLVLPNGLRFPSIRVARTDGMDDVTIGMDIISHLDFALTHPEEKSLFSFQSPPQQVIDFLSF